MCICKQDSVSTFLWRAGLSLWLLTYIWVWIYIMFVSHTCTHCICCYGSFVILGSVNQWAWNYYNSCSSWNVILKFFKNLYKVRRMDNQNSRLLWMMTPQSSHRILLSSYVLFWIIWYVYNLVHYKYLHLMYP